MSSPLFKMYVLAVSFSIFAIKNDLNFIPFVFYSFHSLFHSLLPSPIFFFLSITSYPIILPTPSWPPSLSPFHFWPLTFHAGNCSMWVCARFNQSPRQKRKLLSHQPPRIPPNPFLVGADYPSPRVTDRDETLGELRPADIHFSHLLLPLHPTYCRFKQASRAMSDVGLWYANTFLFFMSC